MKKDNIDSLTMLGSQKTEYKYDKPSQDLLETFENKFSGREYSDILRFNEFTSLCPKTGQPDFAQIVITYTPDKLCIESKSLKLYMFAYRNHGSFMETITNNILEDLVAKCQPKYMKVNSYFNARGGIEINVTAEYNKKAKKKTSASSRLGSV